MTRFRSIYVYLSKRITSDLGGALIRTFIARGIAALGTLALALVIGRIYGPEGMGVYALGYSLLLGAGILSRTGLDLALVRYVGQAPGSPAVMQYLFWAGKRAFLLSLLALVFLWLAREWLENMFEARGLALMLSGIAVAVPAFTFAFVLSGFFKGVRMPATACLLENGSVALVAAVLLALLQWGGSSSGVELVGYAYAAAAWLVAIQGGLQVWFWYRKESGQKVDDVVVQAVPREDFNATSLAFFATNLAGFMQSVLSIMIAGWLLKSSDLGVFKSAQQMAFLISFILIVINAIFPPRFSSLYHQGDMQGLERLARQGALLGILLATPLLLVCLLFPIWVLGWFGDGFSEGASLLRIIASAQLFNVMTGSVGYLLSMTGHERLFRNIAIVSNASGLVAFYLLIPLFGTLGAAWALAFVLVSQNLAALFYVWRKLGLWTVPGPNFLRLVGIHTSARE